MKERDETDYKLERLALACPWDSNFEVDCCPFCYKKMLWNIETQRLECYNPKCKGETNGGEQTK